MKQRPVPNSWFRLANLYERVTGQRVRSGQSGRDTRMDAALLILSLSVLSLSVFSGPLITASRLVVLLAVGAGVLFTASTNGSTPERIGLRRVALFLVVLLNVYLISLTDALSGHVLLGYRLMELGGLLGLAVFGLWVIRAVQMRAFTLIRSPIDLAVLLLCLLTAAGFLGLTLLLHLTGLHVEVKLDLLRVVLLATLLFYILGDLLQTELAVKRTLRLSLFPLIAVGLVGTFSSWQVF
jgi:hypothetical protein